MATGFLSSFISELLSNNSQSDVTEKMISLPGSAWSFAGLACSSTWSWIETGLGAWTWVSPMETKFFSLVTTKPSAPLFAQHRVISNGQFVALFFFCLCSLYALFIVPFVKKCRQKQMLALPMLVVMLLQPLLFTCPLAFIHMSLAVTSIAVSTRMVDLYYIQPWTRIPSRYVIRQASIVPTDAIARSKKDIDLKDDKDTDQDCVTKDHTDTTQITFDEFLNWDMDRFKLEMWSPLRNFSIKPKASHHDAVSPSLRWQDLVLRATLYSVILDIDLYLTSHYTAAQVEAMSTLQYGLFTFGIGAFIILYILWVVLSIAMVYSYSTGRRIDTAEWTMITNKVPCFALTPAEFWISWQTLFRYLWVDLGFLPVERACKRYLTEDRVGVRLARMAREALPVLAVFALSGILHGYVVYAVWGESIWSQIAYFMIQGLGVVVTKALERTVLGTQIRQTYHASGSLVRLCMQVVGILMMGLYHTATLPLFLYPYQKHAMWLEMKERSILWWLFGSL